MYAVLMALLGACSWEGETAAPSDVSSYRTEVRDDLPSPADQGTAPYEGSLGPPAEMVEPVELGTATRTREGSGGPPMRDASEPPPEPMPYQVRGPNSDAHRTTTEPSDRAQSRAR